MNYLNNPKTLARLWAALYCDFECVLAKYMGSEGWRYVHFAAICRELKINLVLHIAQGRGKTKDDHYYKLVNMVLQLCKELWLQAGQAVTGREKTGHDRAMELKRGMGGFFLLYTLYEKQPIRGRVRISVGVEDMKGIKKFVGILMETKAFAEEVIFMLQYLFIKDAFQFCACPEDFRFDPTTRFFLNHSRNEIVCLTKRMRDSQDILAYSTVHKESECHYDKLAKAKHEAARDILKTANAKQLHYHLSGKSAFHMLLRTLPGDKLVQSSDIIDSVVDRPVVTLQALTATEAIDKIMAMETRKRMERARRKALQAEDGNREQRAARPYVREGGIFGRKKEVHEAEDKLKRRERGACNGNLWIYINGHDFKNPNGEQPQKTPAPVEEVEL